MIYLIVFIICYLIGSIPSAYIIVKQAKGIDIRTVGSGNVGATNAARVLGKWGFISVFLSDFLKGLLPVLLVKLYIADEYAMLVAAVAVIVGHTYTIFLKFKGGKGVATAVGVFVALAPLEVAVAAIAFVVIVWLFKMVSLASIIAAITLAASVLVHNDWLELKILTVLIAIFVVYKHKDNIKRIIRGEEKKIGQKIDTTSSDN